MINDVVNAAKVVGGFYDVVHVDAVFRNANRVRLEDVSGLLVCEPATLNVVGVIGQVNLSTVVNAAADFTLFFFSESFEKGRGFPFSSAANWQF